MDEDWIRSIKSSCVDHCPQIVPRYVWEAERFEWSVSTLEAMKNRIYPL